MKFDFTRRQALGFCAATLAPLASSAAEGIKSAPVAPKFRRGMNFHHVLNWPDVHQINGRLIYDWPPFQADHYKISDDSLRRLKGFGFDFIRLTIDPSILLTADSAQWQYLIDHVRAKITKLQAAGFAVIFDLHPVRVNPDYAPQLLVQSPSAPQFGAYVLLVGKIAGALRDLPPDRTIFELMNEPGLDKLAQAGQWQPMLEALHAGARAAAPDLPLLLEGVKWSDRKALMELDLRSFQNSNVLYSFHYYEPHTFTHQGVENDITRFIYDLAWPARRDNADQVYRQAQVLVAAQMKLSEAEKKDARARTKVALDQYVASAHDFDQIQRDFEEVAQWARRNAIPADRIVLGEFGCVISSNGRPLGNDRMNWLAAVRQSAEAMGFSWAYWAFKGYGGMEFATTDGTIHLDLLTPLGLEK